MNDMHTYLHIIMFRSKRAREETEDELRRSKGQQRSRLKRKGKDLQNFYRHQMREERVGVLDELRRKFEEDKARIGEMKAQRKFKPF